MGRTRSLRRKLNASKAIRKNMIAKQFGFFAVPLHYYSKGKVHCSCPLCSAKTNGRHSVFGTCSRRGNNWSPSDIRRIEALDFRENEWELGMSG